MVCIKIFQRFKGLMVDIEKLSDLNFTKPSSFHSLEDVDCGSDTLSSLLTL